MINTQYTYYLRIINNIQYNMMIYPVNQVIKSQAFNHNHSTPY